MSRVVRLVVVALFAVVLPTTSALAQAPGYVRIKLVKAGLMVGAGGGSGVLTYRGRNYPFRVSGLSLGVTAGASVSRLEGWASGIRQVSDFAGTYSSVGSGGTFVGGFGGVQLGRFVVDLHLVFAVGDLQRRACANAAEHTAHLRVAAVEQRELQAR